jgi:hypothetical protein
MARTHPAKKKRTAEESHPMVRKWMMRKSIVARISLIAKKLLMLPVFMSDSFPVKYQESHVLQLSCPDVGLLPSCHDFKWILRVAPHEGCWRFRLGYRVKM